MSNGFKAGFARVNITPPMGIPIAGYYQLRLAERVLDELEANVIAVSDGKETLLLLSVDLIEMPSAFCEPACARISAVTGVARDHIFLSCTHTHTGPKLDGEEEPELRAEYFRFLTRRLADACRFALNDLKPARMGQGTARAPRIAFIRRYRMKDGTIQTNPGVGNPEVLEALGEADDSVGVLRFDREGGPAIVLAHFADHPDTIGGCVISADWPGFARRTVEKALDDTVCVLFNGAQGDVNHVNVFPRGGDLNDLSLDFDDVMRGYGHARHMGRTVAGAVMQVYDKVRYVDAPAVRAAQRVIRWPSNMPEPGQLPRARLYAGLHAEGRDDEIPYKGMMLTTVVAEAERMLLLENGPEDFELRLSVAAIGDAALAGIPGEPFSQTGAAIAMAEGWEKVLPCCCTNGYENYFPLESDYREGGYEARSCLFREGVAEAIEQNLLEMLGKMREERMAKY
ncbi:MAG: hypothetical protein K5981_08100 [Clostridia bacterium]|nr:hypothetical protein [Clostridia bacterium]